MSSPRAGVAIVALVAARLVYAVNWLNIGPIYGLMKSEIGGGVVGLGVITGAFYLGLGVMQVPGGLLASRLGPKKVASVGIVMSSFAVLGTALSGSVAESTVFRFVVGAGMAFTFAPAVSIVSSLVKKERSGLGVGIYNAAFDVGGLAGLFGWVVLAESIGWRTSIGLGGVLGIATGVLVFLMVPRDERQGEGRSVVEPLKAIVKDRRLGLVGLSVMGTSISVSLVSTFIVLYAVESLHTVTALAGLVGSFVFGVGIFSAIVGGRMYDRTRSPRRLMFIANAVGASSLALFAVPALWAAIVGTLVLGTSSGIAFTIAFASGKDLQKAGRNHDSLAISWVNCLSLLGAFWPPLVFSYIVDSVGYSYAWLWGAVVSLLLTVPLLVLWKSDSG